MLALIALQHFSGFLDKCLDQGVWFIFFITFLKIRDIWHFVTVWSWDNSVTFSRTDINEREIWWSLIEFKGTADVCSPLSTILVLCHFYTDTDLWIWIWIWNKAIIQVQVWRVLCRYYNIFSVLVFWHTHPFPILRWEVFSNTTFLLILRWHNVTISCQFVTQQIRDVVNLFDG